MQCGVCVNPAGSDPVGSDPVGLDPVPRTSVEWDPTLAECGLHLRSDPADVELFSDGVSLVSQP